MNNSGLMVITADAYCQGDGEVRVAELVRNMADLIGCGSRAKAALEDAREILSYLLDVSRSWAATHGASMVSRDISARAIRAAQKRALGAPIQYCAGVAVFRNLNLQVDERVLIPRPETEFLVEKVLARKSTGIAVDIGTGSGAIALSLASEGAFTNVIASDISLDALAVARGNAELCQFKSATSVEFVHGSGIAPLRGIKADLVVSNPPYITFAESLLLDEQVRDWEPSLALLAASNGMAMIAELITDCGDVLVSGGLLAMEVDCRRAELAAELAAERGVYRDISIEVDLAGRDRFLFANRI